MPSYKGQGQKQKINSISSIKFFKHYIILFVLLSTFDLISEIKLDCFNVDIRITIRCFTFAAPGAFVIIQTVPRIYKTCQGNGGP